MRGSVHKGFTTTSSHSCGFTLIELLVVIAIIAILATVGLVVYSTTQKSARVSKRIQDLQALQSAMESYKSSTGYYPKAPGVSKCIADTSAGALSASSVSPAFVPTYIQSLPKDSNDPTGLTQCYRYRSDSNGTEYKVWTSNTEMTPTDYATQPNFIDPAADNFGLRGNGNPGAGADACQIDGTNPTDWAIYSSIGIDQTKNACGF